MRTAPPSPSTCNSRPPTDLTVPDVLVRGTLRNDEFIVENFVKIGMATFNRVNFVLSNREI